MQNSDGILVVFVVFGRLLLLEGRRLTVLQPTKLYILLNSSFFINILLDFTWHNVIHEWQHLLQTFVELILHKCLYTDVYLCLKRLQSGKANAYIIISVIQVSV